MKEREYLNCFNCGKVLNNDYRSKFCSHSCSASFNNLGIVRNPKLLREKKICEICGKEFTPVHQYKDQQTCSSVCAGEFEKSKTIKKFINGELSDRQVRGRTIRAYVLKKQNNKCAICNCLPEHNEKPLTFIVDHIDGVFTNNIPENIRVICPNCNSQTDTFAGKNIGKNRGKRNKNN